MWNILSTRFEKSESWDGSSRRQPWLPVLASYLMIAKIWGHWNTEDYGSKLSKTWDSWASHGVPWCPNNSECQGVGCSRFSQRNPSWSHFWEANGLCSTSQRAWCWHVPWLEMSRSCVGAQGLRRNRPWFWYVLVREGGASFTKRAVTWTILNVSDLMHVFAYIPLL